MQKLPYESHLSRPTSEPPKKIVKILETRLQSSKIAPKWTTNCKIHDVDKSTVVFGFQYLFFGFYPEAKQRKIKSWDKTVLKMWSYIFEKNLNFALNVP